MIFVIFFEDLPISKGAVRELKRSGLLLYSVFAGMTLALAACSSSSPEDTAKAYIEHWKNGEYKDMYAMLTNEAKENVDEETFIAKHERIFSDLITEFAVEPRFPEDYEGEGIESVPIAISMETIAGPYSFEEGMEWVQTAEEENEWHLEWEPSLLFPQLEGDDVVRLNRIPGERGDLYDVHGQALATNGEVLEMGVQPSLLEGQDDAVAILANELGITEDYIDEQLSQGWVTPEAFVPLKQLPASESRLADSITEQVSAASYRRLNGRVYPFGEAAAHLTGYIGPITAEELEKRSSEGYSSSSNIGLAGLELVLEDRLRAKDGIEIYTASAEGERKETIIESESEDGEDIHLTIDMDVQEAIFNEFAGKSGTSVALDPLTGETLALVSSPAYDPNLAALGFSSEERKKIEENEEMPLLNRFSASFSPGSTMKALTAAFGLEAGTLVPEETIEVSGHDWQPDDASGWGDYHIHRVTDPGGPVDLEGALMYSDNIYFAMEALKLGEEKLIEQAEAVGFGESIDYLYPLKKSQITGEDGFRSEPELAYSGSGQGQVLVNPVHLATMYTAFSNEGAMIQPVLEQSEQTGVVWKDHLTPETAAIIDEALGKVVSEKSGTAHAMEIDGYPLAAKTGTAELSGGQGESNDDVLGWVVAYNQDDPEMLVAFMQEGARSGEVVPKVKAIFEATR
ncbi:penicillin-binding protein 3 [Niallia circulans]|nr:hypothetical protein BC8716_01590 [Shouchella clausii]PTL20824.1 penicillin-binding transpeptidase domain-containing protein [Shouchella clausii]QNM45193.1 penicillin-binding transpeptidase domain-containing protein [Shouchella clausii]SPT81804.1 penicillin-binding protein 3 [Niallia circulans]